MQSNIPRAAIHVGKDKKSFSAQVGNEAERRGWDENVYRLKNADKEKNNHYNFSRKNLNFEIVKDGKIVPLGSNPIPLHERIQMRLDELGFKPYMDARHPDQVSKNSPNCTVGMIFSGDHDVLYNLAFGNQRIDTANPDADHSHIVLQQGIYKWAKDTYDFACRKWGEGILSVSQSIVTKQVSMPMCRLFLWRKSRNVDALVASMSTRTIPT